jgi:hypothetical protein
VPNPLRAEKFDRIPNALRAGTFAGVNGNSPADVAAASKVVHEKRRRKFRFVAGKIERDNLFALSEKRFQFDPRRFDAVGATQYSNQVHANAGRFRPFVHSFNHRGRDVFWIELVRFRHEPRTESQLDVIDPFALRVFDIFAGYPAAGVGISEDRGHPKHFRNEGHHAGLPVDHLHTRPQLVDRGARQLHAVLCSQLEDRCQPHIAVDVPMQIDQRQTAVDHRCAHFGKTEIEWFFLNTQHPRRKNDPLRARILRLK